MSFSIHYTGIESTESLKTYVEEKLGSLHTYYDAIQDIKVDIGMRSKHHQKGNIFYAEANVFLNHGMVRAEKDAEDLYKAIDLLRDQLKMELDKEKDKQHKIDRNAIRGSKEFSEE